MDPEQSPISCISFDSEEELVFVGHHSGRIVSYESPSLEKYSAFLAHDAPILDIVGVSSSILSLSHTGLRCHKKVHHFLGSPFSTVFSLLLLQGGLQQFDFRFFLFFFYFFIFFIFFVFFVFYFFGFFLFFSPPFSHTPVPILFATTIYYVCVLLLLLLVVSPALFLLVVKCHQCLSLI